MCFVLFGCIWDRLVALKNSRQNRPNWCKNSCHEVTSGFFATNAPDPPHWTLNSCFGMFHTILMHLGPFGWLAKLDEKRAELMRKFVPRSRVRMFRNERTRSTPLDPKLMVWCVSYYLGALGTIFCPTTLCAKQVNWCKSSCHEVALEFFATNAPGPPHWTLNFCFRAICTILVHLGLFGCFRKLGAERAEPVQKFMPRSRIGIFRNESTRSDPLDPKLTFWCVSYYLGAFGTLWLP